MLHAKIFELGKVVALHKGIGRVALLDGQGKAAVELHLARRLFFHVVHALRVLRLQHLDFGIELHTPDLIGVFLITNDLACADQGIFIHLAANKFAGPGFKVFGKNRRLALDFGLKP